MIFLDNASTTRPYDNVISEMKKSLEENYGNPSSSHRLGKRAKTSIEIARTQLATLLNCHNDEIIFTSGGTEANNLALKGMLVAGDHFITSSIEHPAILNQIESLEKMNIECSICPVTPDGIIDMEVFKTLFKDNTRLVSIMMSNNETGILQPIINISDYCKHKNVLFHTDAVQSVGHVKIDLQESFNIDMLSLSAHKFHGPKGVGALFVRKHIKEKLNPHILGGGQELGARSGTENVTSIVGMGYAAEEIFNNFNKQKIWREHLNNKLILGLSNIEGCTFNGNLKYKSDNIVNVSFENVNGESLQTLLELYSIFVSTGSACSSHSNSHSHVLSAMNIPERLIDSSIRISLGELNSEYDIDVAIETISKIVSDLRKLN